MALGNPMQLTGRKNLAIVITYAPTTFLCSVDSRQWRGHVFNERAELRGTQALMGSSHNVLGWRIYDDGADYVNRFIFGTDCHASRPESLAH